MSLAALSIVGSKHRHRIDLHLHDGDMWPRLSRSVVTAGIRNVIEKS